MPTENRSSNTEMVSVPRNEIELTVHCLRMAGEESSAGDLQTYLDQPAEQYQGEPVALPSCNAKLSDSHDWDQGYRDGWRACLDEIAKLGPLYTRADPGEVEQLRAALEEWKRRCQYNADTAHDVALERDTLRAQLAEQDSLLRDAALHASWMEPNSAAVLKRIKAVLRASAEPSDECAHSYANGLGCPECGENFGAEPSAPVERDGLKPCPFCGCQVTLLTGEEDIRVAGAHEASCPFLDLDVIVDGRHSWQVRAATERKP